MRGIISSLKSLKRSLTPINFRILIVVLSIAILVGFRHTYAIAIKIISAGRLT